jgi:hypothetical protein
MDSLKYILRVICRGVMIFSILLHLASCESTLFIDLEESEKLIVVNGTISSDSTVAVQVSRTRHILDNAPVVPLEHATVRLLQDGSLVQELVYSFNGYYRSAGFMPAVGPTYTLEVENPGFPPVSASCEIPGPVPILSLDTVTVSREEDFGYGAFTENLLQFDLTLSDPPGEDNYYLLYAMADRSWTEWRDTTVRIVDSLYYGGQWNYFPKDSTYTIFDIHRFTGNAGIVTEDLVVEARTSHGVLFSDQVIDGKTYSFRGEIYQDQLRAADSAVLDFRLLSISESYYKYLKTRQQHYDTKENYLAVPVIVYSNVESGTGFFGGYSTDEHTITTFVPEYYWDYRYSNW